MSRTEILLNFIRESVLEDPGVEINVETSLFGDQVLDSLNLIEVIGYLESKFGIRVTPTEVTIENLDTVSRMSTFLDRKLVD